MKQFSWQVLLGLSLVVLSALFYLLHYAIFGDARDLLSSMIVNIAFAPISVLLVTMIIHRLLSERERRARLEKLNMVIGVFFSEVGTRLLAFFSDFDLEVDKIRRELVITDDWSAQEFSRVSKRLRSYDYQVEVQKVNLEALQDFLVEKADFLLRLLENPNLLEHESFTELLRSVFHLTEELAARGDVRQLPDTDRQHLCGDINRAYSLLVYQWFT